MPWSAPAARMREFILAMKAIWSSWNTGEQLKFRGEFYQHTLMTPMFSPPPNPWGPPPVLLAAVGPQMTRVAAEAADGMLVHGFTTERYLREITLPLIHDGLRASGRGRDRFSICYPGLVATGDTDADLSRCGAWPACDGANAGGTTALLPQGESPRDRLPRGGLVPGGHGGQARWRAAVVRGEELA